MPGSPNTFIPRRIAGVAGCLSVAIGSLVLVGWYTHIPAMARIFPEFATMKFNTALSMVWSALALLALWRSQSVKRDAQRWLGPLAGGLSCAVALMGACVLIEYAAHLDLHVDQLFWNQAVDEPSAFFPGRMSPVTAFNFLFLGAALFTLWRRRAGGLVQTVGILLIVSSFAAITGYFYGAAVLYAAGQVVAVALPTAISFLALSIGMLCLQADRGLVKMLISPGLDGSTARRYVPAAVLIPFLIGWGRTWAQHHGWFDTETGAAIYCLATIALFLSLILWNTQHLARAEVALHESARRYAFLADTMPQMIWTSKPDGNLDYYNQHWYDYTGMTFEQTKDWGWKPAIHPDDLQVCTDQWTRSFTTGQPYEVEYRLKRGSDGTYRWHLGRAFPLRDKEGAIVQWVGTCTDIENQKQARAELEKGVADRTAELAGAKARLQAVLDAATRVSVIAADTEGMITLFNAGSEVMLGYTAEEIVGKQTPALFHLEAEVLARGQELSALSGRKIEGFEVFADLPRRGKSEEREWTYVRKDGSRISVLLAVTATHDALGRLDGFLGIATDITERIRAEEHSRHIAGIVASSHDAILSKKLDGTILSWNPAAELLYGYTPAEAIGASVTMLIPPDRLSEEGDIIARIKRGESIDQFESVRMCKDGRLVDVSLTISAVRNIAGEIIGAAKIARDITEKQRVIAQLRTATHAAEAANRAKSEFLANMSHEIRTPMNGIIGMTELVLDTELTSTQRDQLEMAKYSADSLLSLINDILDFSKIEAGKLSLECVPFDLRDRVEKTLQTLGLRAERKGLRLACEIDPAVPPSLKGDPTRIPQILINLVDNAIKFTDKGEINVAVKVVREEGDQVALKFSVRDSGIGISAEKQGVIFEAFAQADGSTTRTYGGTGLGLTICSLLVQQMGGRLAVESTPGRGSTFHFTISLAKTLDARPGGRNAHDDRQHNSGWGGRRVLIAEDNLVNQAVISGILEKLGCVITCANNGQEAVDLVQRARFDLVLMDVQMPVIDGFGATARIRELEKNGPRHTPIVALTAFAMTGDRERCLAAGMDGYLSKPIKKQELLEVMQEFALGDPTEPDPAAVPPPVDLLAHFDGDTALLRRVSRLFAEQTPKLLEAIEGAILSEDGLVLGRAAHKLIGSLGALDANEAVASARKLESLGDQNTFAPAAELFSQLKSEMNSLQSQLVSFK